MWSSAAVDHLLQGSMCCVFRDDILQVYLKMAGECIYTVYISGVKQLIGSKISFCLHKIYVCCVYLLRIYKYTHKHEYVYEKSCLYII